MAESKKDVQSESASVAIDKPGAPFPIPLLIKVIQSITGPWTLRNLGGWLGIILVILVIKGCLVDQYTIPSASMAPTLNGDVRFFRGDRLLVNKWRYGPRIPFTTHRLWRWGQPERWDIVVFRAVDPDADHPVLVKRVVGLPGEEVHIAEGHIYVDGERIAFPDHLADVLHYTRQLEISRTEQKRQVLRLAQINQPLPMLNQLHPPVQTLYAEMERLHEQMRDVDIDALTEAEVEALCAETPHAAVNLVHSIYDYVQPDMPYGIREESRYALIPDDHYFMLGDNSPQSLDSRMYGWVPHNHLYGRAFAIWWPWPHRRDFTGFSNTWWGMGLLYGIPVLIVAIEIVLALRRKKDGPG